MNDKIVTHADLNTIEDARRWIANVPVGQEAINGKARVLDLLDRLRVEAEADAPPLPEGWVLCESVTGPRVLWHDRGVLYVTSNMGSPEWATVDGYRDRLAPLRPTVTEADVEKAAIAYMSNGEDAEWHPDDSEEIKKHGRKAARLMLAAAGIEVV